MYHSFFIHSAADGHLGCFHVLAIVNSAAGNIGVHVSFSVLVSSGYTPRSGIAGSYGGFIPSFYRNLTTLFHSGCMFTFPPAVRECSPFSTPTLAFIVCRLFDEGHSDWCDVVSHCSFDYFSNNEWCWASLHEFVSHLYVFLGEMSLQVSFPLFDWVVCFSGIELYELYILEINSLSVVSFAIIFSHSEGCLLTLFVVSFAVQKLLTLMRSHHILSR